METMSREQIDKIHWLVLRTLPLAAVLMRLGAVCESESPSRSTWNLDRRKIVIMKEKQTFIGIDDPEFQGSGALDLVIHAMGGRDACPFVRAARWLEAQFGLTRKSSLMCYKLLTGDGAEANGYKS